MYMYVKMALYSILADDLIMYVLLTFSKNVYSGPLKSRHPLWSGEAMRKMMEPKAIASPPSMKPM